MPVKAMVLVVTGWLVGVPAWAHHSHANYDMTVYHNVEGRVTDIHWINPHLTGPCFLQIQTSTTFCFQ